MLDNADLGSTLESSVNNAMSRYFLARQLSEHVGGGLIDKVFPDRKGQQLMALEIMLKRRQLGLPENTSEYEDLLNERQTVLDPGRMITLGSVATQSEKPLLKLGASPFLKGFQHGPAGRAIGAIGRIFGK